jgi:hypothetical protein
MDQYFVELPEKEPENIPDFVGLANLKKTMFPNQYFASIQYWIIHFADFLK